MKLYWNWEVEDLSINKNGFLLSDACVGVLIVGLCACMTASVIISHHRSKELIRLNIEQSEADLEAAMERNQICEDEQDLP
jgi:hypothetical protein